MNQVSNPFGGIANQIQATPMQTNALVETESQRSIAEVQAAMAIAKKFPRDQRQAMDRILNLCQRESLAGTAIYQYFRGGTKITGASIRLAEAVAQNWGNIKFGIRELSQNNGESTVEAYAWDLETNTQQSKVFQVPHVRYSRAKGNTKLTDPRDIYELIASNGARRLRACILSVIPSDVIDTAVEQCNETIESSADCTPNYIKKLLGSFEGIGVSKAMVEKRIQCHVNDIQPAQVVALINIGTSIKDGYAEISDFFDVGQQVEQTSQSATDLNSAINNAVNSSTNNQAETANTANQQPVKSNQPTQPQPIQQQATPQQPQQPQQQGFGGLE